MTKTTRFFSSLTFAFVFISVVLASCTSTPQIPENASATQLIQLGQDALEVSNYKAAESYYMAVIQRYGTDINLYVEARYELGHMYFKQKKYDEAYTCYDEILKIYANSEYGALQGAFKKLAQIGMENLPERYRTAE